MVNDFPKTTPAEDPNFIALMKICDVCCERYGDNCPQTEDCRELYDKIADVSARNKLTYFQRKRYQERILGLIENPPLL